MAALLQRGFFRLFTRMRFDEFVEFLLLVGRELAPALIVTDVPPYRIGPATINLIC